MSLLAVASCAAPPPPKTPVVQAPAPEPEDSAQHLKRLRTWEPQALSIHQVTLPDGLGSFQVRAAAPPETACADAEGSKRCTVHIPLGKDSDSVDNDVACVVTEPTAPPPFGVLVHSLTEGWTLSEPPVLDVSMSQGNAPGMVVRFSAFASKETDDSSYVATIRGASRYAPQSHLFCFSHYAGGIAAFRSTTQLAFDTFSKQSDTQTGFVRFVRKRRGQSTTGFRADVITKTDSGTEENAASCSLTLDDNRWDIRDFAQHIERGKRGEVDSMRSVIHGGPSRTTVLTAKPSEAGKFFLKLETGVKANTIERKPSAPLSSELWESARLKQVAYGNLPQTKYAFLSVDEDGDPTFFYSVLRKQSKATLLETVEAGKSRKAKPSEESNELSVDPNGIVTKQVSPDAVYEQIYTSGAIPTPGSKASAPLKRP